jgi:hypothetical protein
MGDIGITARAYGENAGDLDVPFESRPADETTTALLAACLGAGGDDVLRWSLARRLQALLVVREAGGSGGPLQAVVRCSHCSTHFELELDPAQCRADVDDGGFSWTAPDNSLLQLRLPSAADLALWRAQGCTDPAVMVSSLVRVVDVEADAPMPPADFHLPVDWVGPISAVLAERDPLGALQVDAVCPDCGGINATDIDLESLLLAEFAQRQRRLLEDIAALARAFHWTEAQILALPAWRRAFYLARLGNDGAVLP